MRNFWNILILAIGSPLMVGDVSAEQKKWKGNMCVEPTPIMRRAHMDFLLQQRDKTMRQGIRTQRYSLKGCIDCHVQRDEQGQLIPINAPEQFCRNCHEYVAVNIDCFQCHLAISDD